MRKGLHISLDNRFDEAVKRGDLTRAIHGEPQGSRHRYSDALVPPRKPNCLRILLVEDTFSSRRLAELILRNQGHSVYSASNGRDAVELAKLQTWDILLMDLQMPLMNGWEATREIRLHERKMGITEPVPIVALSAYSIRGNRERSLEIGMNDFLAKPIDPNLLVELVEKYASRNSESPQGKNY